MNASKNVQATTSITAGSPKPRKTTKKNAKAHDTAIPMISGKDRARKTSAKAAKAARAADAVTVHGR